MMARFSAVAALLGGLLVAGPLAAADEGAAWRLAGDEAVIVGRRQGDFLSIIVFPVNGVKISARLGVTLDGTSAAAAAIAAPLPYTLTGEGDYFAGAVELSLPLLSFPRVALFDDDSYRAALKLRYGYCLQSEQLCNIAEVNLRDGKAPDPGAD